MNKKRWHHKSEIPPREDGDFDTPYSKKVQVLFHGDIISPCRFYYINSSWITQSGKITGPITAWRDMPKFPTECEAIIIGFHETEMIPGGKKKNKRRPK